MERATPGVVAFFSVLLGGDSSVRAVFEFLGFKCFFLLGRWSLYSLSDPKLSALLSSCKFKRFSTLLNAGVFVGMGATCSNGFHQPHFPSGRFSSRSKAAALWRSWVVCYPILWITLSAQSGCVVSNWPKLPMSTSFSPLVGCCMES